MMHTRWIALIGCLVWFSGCASLTTNDKSKSKKEKSWLPWGNKEYQIPQSLAVVWSEDILNVPGKPATRGFGGRIYFYNEKSQAISVEGELTVHGYDETFAKPGGVVSPEADKTFKFTPEQFTQHFSQSDLGASYSVWIPWDNGGYGKKIMLIPSFITKDGRLIRGEPSKVTLAGKSPTSQDVFGPSTVQQVSHTEPTNDQPLQRIQVATEDQGQMKTTTIRMPGNRRAPARSTPNLTPMGSESAFDNSTMPTNNFSNQGMSTSVRYSNGMTAEQMQAMLNAAQGNPANNGAMNVELQRMLLEAQLNQRAPSSPSGVNQNAVQPNSAYPANVQNLYQGVQPVNYQQPVNAAPMQGASIHGATPNLPGAAQSLNGFGVQGMPVQATAYGVNSNGFTSQAIATQSQMKPPTSGSSNPEFPQMDWSELSARSVWSSHQAPNAPISPPASYPTR